MNRDALLRHWENLEQQFAVLLDRLANIAPDLDVRGVQHYLDHNEFGLALEQLGWVLVSDTHRSRLASCSRSKNWHGV